MKYLNKSEKESARLQIISEEQWISHYQELWFNNTETYVEGDFEVVGSID